MSDPATAELERLRLRYRLRLTASLRQLAAALERTHRASPAPSALEEAWQLAHRLKGSAGTYGFHETSAALARIEEALDALRGAAPQRLVPALWRSIDCALALLARQSADSASPSREPSGSDHP